MLSIEISKKLAHFVLEAEFQVGNEIVVFFGPSGSGKTTILNCIAGISHPDDGYIDFNGRSFFSKNAKPLSPQRRKIGYLVQDYALFPHMTVEKNILFGIPRKNDAAAKKAMKPFIDVLKIEPLFAHYPHQISGGEKQRVALARALATEPNMLLLDEPLSALDSETRERAQKELLRIHQQWQIPFVIVTHDLTEAKKLADRIVYFEQGKIIRIEANDF
jgi:molybdate transport system ATP-binding protein